jgi:hypothetical protein
VAGRRADIPLCETGPMRRLVFATVLTLGLVTGPALPALAAPAAPAARDVRPATAVAARVLAGPATAVPARILTGPATPGKPVCKVSGPGMVELSGLAVTPTGYVAMNDSNNDPSAMQVFLLTSACKRKGTLRYPAQARDPEDLAIGPGGAVWVADTGDNPLNPTRPRIALWKLPFDGSGQAPPYRFTYPDGAHDCEALLFDAHGLPVFITKVASGPAGVYVPTAALDPSGNPVRLRRAGQFQPSRTGTPNPLGAAGQNAVTGAAKSLDGTRVVVRTYADAYEFDVSGGDVVKAVTSGRPRITPLPNEPMGEGIAYTRDGRYFLTVADQPGPVSLLRYAPTPPARPTPKHTQAAAGGGGMLGGLGLQQVTYIVVAVGVLGALLVLAGLIGIRRSRGRPHGQENDDADDFDDAGYDEDPYGYGPDDEPGGYRPGAGGAYRPDDGYRPASGGAPAPGVYGAPGSNRAGGPAPGVYGAPGRSADPPPDGGSGRVYGGRGRHDADPAPGRHGRRHGGERDRGYDGGFFDPDPSGGYDRGFAQDPEPSGGYERGSGGRVYGRDPDGRDGHGPDRYDRGR